MRFLMRLLAPALFWFTFMLFRASPFKRSERKHRLLMKWFRFAADNGSEKALSVYGHLLHFRGEGVQNRIQGGIYLQRAAEKGDSKACFQMGKIYESGFEHYFQPDQARALSFYRKAAEAGHQLAIRRLADAYDAGELGLEVDKAEAGRWSDRLPEIPGGR
ncbi:tetratricopeptide repeat protein [Marinobacterium jannaschii]|uniref:tetratricopeptide repeat protein n=1 Tax=Marinobacterium jannaschii TaxID=64970 RepID=UPI00047F82C0|nr:tetratricopeptide repeat protein [Marinobacterium jannaschii]